MRLAQRTFGYRYPHYRQFRSLAAGCRIECDGHTLYVEDREFYTSYRMYDYYGRVVLSHDVRSMEPLPVRPAQIIHARHIPWFMWIIYAVRDWWRKRQWDRQMEEWAERDDTRRAAIRQAVKERGLGRFGGRYNR